MSLIQQVGKKSLDLAQDLGLLVVAIASIIAFGMEVVTMVDHRRVALEDLLLLFIYLEVLSMVAMYLQLGKLPIRIPLYIAIVALSRDLILNMKDMDTWHLIAVAVAALILAVTVFVIRFGHLRYPYPKDEAHHS